MVSDPWTLDDTSLYYQDEVCRLRGYLVQKALEEEYSVRQGIISLSLFKHKLYRHTNTGADGGLSPTRHEILPLEAAVVVEGVETLPNPKVVAYRSYSAKK